MKATVDNPIQQKEAGHKQGEVTRFLPIRTDLEVSRQTFEGGSYAVLKDPVGFSFTRIRWRDYELVRVVTSPLDINQVIERWLDRFPELRVEFTREQLVIKAKALAVTLINRKLSKSTGSALRKIQLQRVSAEQRTRRASLATSWLSIRRKLIDPDKSLERITPKLAFVFTKWFQTIVCVYVIASLIAFFYNIDEGWVDTGWYQSLPHLVALYLVLFGLKIIHEIGHGVVCKHYGGEVHEAGIWFLFLTPMFYVNTTDAWMFPNKWHRIAVSAAGIYIEILFAAILVPIWLLLEPGFLKQLALHGIFIATISTVLFNANPLMKFDGYYVLMDLLEIPNLKTKAATFINTYFKKLLFGKSAPNIAPGIFSPKAKRSLILYAVLSSLYILLIVTRLCRFVDAHLADIGLRFLGAALICAAVYGMLIKPIIRIMSDSLNKKHELSISQRVRPWLIIVLAILTIGAILQIHVPHRIRRSCIVETITPNIVRSSESGFISQIFVDEGDSVRKGDIIAIIEEPSLETELKIERANLASISVSQREAAFNKSAEGVAISRYALENTQRKIEVLEERLSAMTVCAPSDGVVTTRDLKSWIGRYVTEGSEIMRINNNSTLGFLIPLNESESKHVSAGLHAEIRLSAVPDKNITCSIQSEPIVPLGNNIPASLSQRRSGDIFTTLNSVTGDELPDEMSWFVFASPSNSDNDFHNGMTGYAMIYCGSRPMWTSMKEQIYEFFRIDYRL